VPGKVTSHEETVRQEGPVAPSSGSSAESSAYARCNGDCLLGALRAAGQWLNNHVASVNALNVFPVPDGDTGTNMSLTMCAALEEVGDGLDASVSDVARAVARGAPRRFRRAQQPPTRES